MSIIHNTTLKPTKVELLTQWLPRQTWYRGTGTPELTRTGGFRLDDPAGAVGLEFAAVTDVSGPEPVTYHVPMAYRGAPLDGAEASLIGTTEHGVLGDRWVYDGAHDPVLLTELERLARGEVPAHAQRVSDQLDPTVRARLDAGAGAVRAEIVRVLESGDPAAGAGEVSARWRPAGPDGPEREGVFVLFRAE
ncbi:1,4-alpha-glucan branching protein [Streptomyces sp. SID5785]|uniref:maltokinase N-terminal cap-like domain-containing protein n=1 Tax=Streptomyces sp. SID5785 TaxID=2690309 RepID=UPI0013618AB8|nr:1,4-alpha-glucan branching protein [Streptomyces sp. SID5785]MZD06423.1 1,4-alpha-glucan branching protein [Streptomyces sp. SID5785]